jgi:hypothetical protein
MTRTWAALCELLGDDRELVDVLVAHGILPEPCDTVEDEQVEAALVARTLLRELEVNAPGVEIIVRLRAELIATRRQVGEILRLLSTSR